MKFTVKTINSNRHEFEVDENETVESLKLKLQEKTGIDPARQKLIFLGKVLQNQKKLSEYNVDGKVLHLVESANGAGPSTAQQAPRTRSAPSPSDQEAMRGLGEEANRMMDQIMTSLGVDVNQARVTRHSLDNGGVAVNLSLAGGTNEEFDIQIINSTNDAAPPGAQATPPQQPGGAPQASTGPTTTSTGTATSRRGPPATLERVISHLRSVRDLMQHINCTAPSAQDIVSSVLMQPCIRGQHTAGPSVEQGATPEEVNQRANSRETIETYAHIMIDMADIMQELVRYMNQYAKLLHRDPPLSGGDLVHCQNLVDRLGAVFHEISHAFHSLSDYSITLDSPLPRRLWMAQIAGAHQIVVETNNNGAPPTGATAGGVAYTQQMRQEMNRLQTQLRNLAGRIPGDQAQRPAAPAAAPPTPADAAAAAANARAAAQAAGTAAQAAGVAAGAAGAAAQAAAGPVPPASGGPTPPPDRRHVIRPRATATPAPGGGTQYSVSFELPITAAMGRGGTGAPNLRHVLQSRAVARGGPSMGPIQSSLRCHSRHSIPFPARCPVHQAGSTGQPTHGHTHSHGPRHGHSHHRPPFSRPPTTGAAAATQPAQPRTNTTTTAPPPSAPPPQTPPRSNFMQQLITTLTGDEDPARAARYTRIAERMMTQPDQPMSTFFPEMREVMAANTTIPETSRVGEMVEIVGSRYTCMEFLNALQHPAMFDILYHPLRSHLTDALFSGSPPADHVQIDRAVLEILSQEREFIIASFDLHLSSTEIDEGGTIILIVREFLNRMIRALYDSDVAAGFGREFGASLLRLFSLSMALNRELSDANSDQARMMGSLMSGMRFLLPLQEVPSAEFHERYVVRHPPPPPQPSAPEPEPEPEPVDEDEEEFVDAEDGESPAPTAPVATPPKEEEKEEAMEGVENGDGRNGDGRDGEIPDEVLVPRRNARAARRGGAAVAAGGGTEPPAAVIPAEWRAVLEKDAAVLSSATYEALSDGYIASLPAKRRRTTNTSATTSDQPAEILGELLGRSGASAMAATAASRDPELATVFRDRLRNDLRRKIRENGDVTEEQFPAASALKKSREEK